MFRCVALLAIYLLYIPFANGALSIASALGVIEWTPEEIAKDFYNGKVTIYNGGVPNLFTPVNSTNATVDLASNAETQALRNFAKHKNLRIIYTISEVAYRIVADKRKIRSLQDLKGKKIGAFQGTSSGYFVEKYLETPVRDGGAGLQKGEYEIKGGNQCLAEPCGNGTLPYMLKNGSVDAVGFWEPTVELAARAIGKNNSIFFQDFDIYREIFSLHTTTEKLSDPAKRKEIVSFIRALEKALKLFRDNPDEVIGRAAKAMNPPMTEELMRAVWSVHRWPGTIPRDLPEVLAEEDVYTARVDNRTVLTAEELRPLVDGSILEEVRDEEDEEGRDMYVV